jgi:hypothetical protein
MLFEFDGDRSATVGTLLSFINRNGIRVIPGSSWDNFDARLLPSFILSATVTSSAYPIHWLQVRVRRCIRPRRACVYLAVLPFMIRDRAFLLTGTVAAIFLCDLLFGWWRSGPHLRRIIRSAGDSRVVVS